MQMDIQETCVKPKINYGSAGNIHKNWLSLWLTQNIYTKKVQVLFLNETLYKLFLQVPERPPPRNLDMIKEITPAKPEARRTKNSKRPELDVSEWFVLIDSWKYALNIL